MHGTFVEERRLRALVDQQAASVDRLQKANDLLDDVIGQQAAEIKRLEAIQDGARQVWQEERETLQVALARAEATIPPLAAGVRVMHDLHDALGVQWGSDPYARIAALKEAEAALAACPSPADRARALEHARDAGRLGLCNARYSEAKWAEACRLAGLSDDKKEDKPVESSGSPKSPEAATEASSDTLLRMPAVGSWAVRLRYPSTQQYLADHLDIPWPYTDYGIAEERAALYGGDVVPYPVIEVAKARAIRGLSDETGGQNDREAKTPAQDRAIRSDDVDTRGVSPANQVEQKPLARHLEDRSDQASHEPAVARGVASAPIMTAGDRADDRAVLIRQGVQTATARIRRSDLTSPTSLTIADDRPVPGTPEANTADFLNQPHELEALVAGLTDIATGRVRPLADILAGLPAPQTDAVSPPCDGPVCRFCGVVHTPECHGPSGLSVVAPVTAAYVDRLQQSTRALADRTLQVEHWPSSPVAAPVTAETTTHRENLAEAEGYLAAQSAFHLAASISWVRNELARLQRSQQEAETTLKAACDRSWEHETLPQIAVIASNAIYWRQQHIADLRQQLAEAETTIARLTADVDEARHARDQAHDTIARLTQELQEATTGRDVYVGKLHLVQARQSQEIVSLRQQLDALYHDAASCVAHGLQIATLRQQIATLTQELAEAIALRAGADRAAALNAEACEALQAELEQTRRVVQAERLARTEPPPEPPPNAKMRKP